VEFANSGEEVGAEDYLQYIFETPSESAGSR
jgi:hypothetical protein